MPTEYRKCRNAEPDNPRLPEPVRNLDRQMTAIGFRTDLGSYKNGKDLDDAVDHLAKLITKYQLLLNQAGMPNLMPVVQYDWEAILRTPWIE